MIYCQKCGTKNSKENEVCKKCGAVSDLTMPDIDSVMEAAASNFSGTIEGYDIYFYGSCERCRE